MLIDFHTHIFPEKIAAKTLEHLSSVCHIVPETDGTENGLLQSMDAAGIDCSVVLPVVTAPRQFDSIRRFAYSINERYGYLDKSWKKGQFPRLISFGGIHPDSADYRAKLKALAADGFAGIKVHPDYQGTFFNDIRYKRIISCAQELGLAVVTHAGVDVGLPDPVHCTPSMALEVSRETEAEKLILAHFGGWRCWDELKEMYACKKVQKGQFYLDTAFIQNDILPAQFSGILEKTGEERILFATDSPWISQKRGTEWLKEQSMSEEIRKNVGFWNAAGLLGIKRSDFSENKRATAQ